MTTTVQLAALTQAVAGDGISVRPLIGAGVDAHEYEPSAGDVRDVADARLVLRNGLGLDDFLDAALAGSGQTRIVTATEGVRTRVASTSAEQTGAVAPSGGNVDPHVWHDSANAKVMVDNIAKALSQTYPDRAAGFSKNAEVYKQKLDDVDAQIKALVAQIPPQRRKMVTNHEAFGYFIDRYGLTFVGAVLPTSTEGEASTKHIAALVEVIKREEVPAIFAESSLDPKVLREIGKETKVKVVDDLYGDSLAKTGAASTVDGMLLENAKKIVEALK